ncbi:hypothetical protein GLYMA_08G281450v4 [Glycine max]|nr:hypothetical protein GLYMA_08G281450v4 [Glycine max]KAH1053466.1 hypothetical protein GYH30_022657 [Glycine max]
MIITSIILLSLLAQHTQSLTLRLNPSILCSSSNCLLSQTTKFERFTQKVSKRE